MSLNTVSVMGNLTRDPEVKHVPSGTPLCGLSIANNRIYSKNGEKVEEVSYFDVDVWGHAAENCSKYLIKGSGIIVEGRLKQDRWEKDGKKQSRVRITANAVHFLPKKKNNAASHDESSVSADNPTEIQSEPTSSPDDMTWEE